MAEQKEMQNNVQKAFSKENLKAILTSSPFLILSFVFSALGAVSTIIDYKDIITKIGLISFCIGMLGIVVYAIVAYKKIKKLKAELRKKIQETQKETTTFSSIPMLNETIDVEVSAAPSNNSKINESISSIMFWNEDNLYISKEIFGQNFRIKHQNIPILQQPNLSIQTINDIYSKLCASINQDEKIWIDDEKTDSFSLIYVNTSVLYFLIQLGLEFENPIVKKAYKYLDSFKEISINNRAKWFFDIQTNKINESSAIEFLQLIESKQIQQDRIDKGAFIFYQANDTSHWEPTHPGGYSFHACHVADVLLHISPSLSIARERAKKILKEIAYYLKSNAKANNGFLLDLSKKPSLQLTTWYYYLSERLGNQLEKDWETNLINILSQTRGESKMLRKSFLVMNLAELIYTHSNMKDTTIKYIYSYFEYYYKELSDHLKNEKSNNVELSVFGRVLLYCNLAIGNDLRNIYKTIIK